MAKNYATPKRSPSLGSGKRPGPLTPFRGLRTTNPQSNFSSRITTLKQVGSPRSISAGIKRY